MCLFVEVASHIREPFIDTGYIEMGASESKKSNGKRQNKSPKKIRQQGYVLPQDPVLYQGPQCQYQLIDVPVTMQSSMVFNFAQGRQMVSTNVDSYYSVLCQPYNTMEGYKMATFYRVPGAGQTAGFFSMAVNIPYQGIFSRYPGMPDEPHCQLKVVKSIMYVQQMRTGLFLGPIQQQSDTSHLYEVIQENTAAGGRLICLEMTGQLITQGVGAAMAGFSAGMGIDIFFDMPLHPSPALYTYQSVSVPVNVSVSMGFPSPTITVQCDWLGVLASYLQMGWKLVEIFLDQTQRMHGGAFTSSVTLNSIWFFEKMQSKLDDNRPLFEGTVVAFEHKVSATLGGASVRSTWTPLLEEMGSKGWQLACIVETPETRIKGMATICMKLLFFFQRPLAYSNSPSNVDAVQTKRPLP